MCLKTVLDRLDLVSGGGMMLRMDYNPMTKIWRITVDGSYREGKLTAFQILQVVQDYIAKHSNGNNPEWRRST